jgi:hypothetical protein
MNHPAASCEVSQHVQRLMVRIRLVDHDGFVGKSFPVLERIS